MVLVFVLLSVANLSSSLVLNMQNNLLNFKTSFVNIFFQKFHGCIPYFSNLLSLDVILYLLYSECTIVISLLEIGSTWSCIFFLGDRILSCDQTNIGSSVFFCPNLNPLDVCIISVAIVV